MLSFFSQSVELATVGWRACPRSFGACPSATFTFEQASLGYICSDRRSLGFGGLVLAVSGLFAGTGMTVRSAGRLAVASFTLVVLFLFAIVESYIAYSEAFGCMCWSVGSKLSGAYSVRPGSWIALLRRVFFHRHPGLYANIFSEPVLPQRESIGSYVA